jgi:hypothetical protein
MTGFWFLLSISTLIILLMTLSVRGRRWLARKVLAPTHIPLRHARVLLTAVALFAFAAYLASVPQQPQPETPAPPASPHEESAIKPAHITPGEHVGCPDQNHVQSLLLDAAEKDETVFEQTFAAGDCTWFKAGEPVFVTDTAISSGLAKIRRQGDGTEYWISIMAIDTPK